MSRSTRAPLPFEGDPDCDASPNSSPKAMTPPTLAGSTPRALGAYYTPPTAAQFLARWALRNRGDRVLEPSMGAGVFLQALQLEDARRRLASSMWGVEMALDTYESTVESGLILRDQAICSDFLDVDPFEVDAVIGNPPYVRCRHLSDIQFSRALAVAERVLQEPMDPSGSVWMAFVLHAAEFLVRGGRLALVLPYDLTYVRYARPLWRFLGEQFGALSVIRVHERMFPEILQETVLLLADDYGDRTASVSFEAYESVARLEANRPNITSQIMLDGVVAGDRAFLEALLSDEAKDLLSGRIEQLTVPARHLVTFNIGYVCGDKNFFHPSASTIEAYDVPSRSLRPTLTSSRQLRGAGIRTGSLPSEGISRLFLPSLSQPLTKGEQDYVHHGESLGVSQRYRCRIRDPWYITPGVRVPDVIVPVFTEKPALLMNDARVVASNSLLCGYLKDTTAERLVSAWFTSLTLLQLELEVHSLGGGVMVLVPREAGNVRLPRVGAVDEGRLDSLHHLLCDEKMDLAFSSGDEPVLIDVLGFSRGEVSVIEEAAGALAHWRTAARSGAADAAVSSKDIQEQQAALEGFDHAIGERRHVEVAVRH